MMARVTPPKSRTAWIVSAVLMSIATSVALAQTKVEMQSQIAECVQAADDVKFHAWSSALMAGSIVLLGFALANLPKTTPRSHRFALSLSALVAIMTFTTSTLYPESAKGLFDLCSNGYKTAEEARQRIALVRQVEWDDVESRGVVNEEFVRVLSGCTLVKVRAANLRSPFSSAGRGSQGPERFGQQQTQKTTILSSFSVAMAWGAEDSDRVPKWVRRVPTDSAVLYFLGTAHDATLRTAQREAIRNARQQVEEYVVTTVAKAMRREQAPTGGYAAAAQLSVAAASAGVADTFWNHDGERKLYDYYVLLRLDRRETERLVTLWLADEGIDAARRAGKATGEAAGPSPDYQRRRQEKYAEVLDVTRKGLSPSEYDQFLKAREQRKRPEPEDKGEIEVATAGLKAVVDEHPDLYLGWFNLALAYQKAGNTSKANEAYERTRTLGEQQNLNDPSLYSSYGIFLYRQEEYARAAELLREAVRLEQQHPYARRYLKLAQSKMPEKGSSGTPGVGPEGLSRSDAYR
jgi:tetratricopeptide (TPR) repeat protein